MGNFGRITELADLPPDHVLIGYVRKAAVLNESGLRAGSRERRTAKPGRASFLTISRNRSRRTKKTRPMLSHRFTVAQATLRTHKRRDSARVPQHHLHE